MEPVQPVPLSTGKKTTCDQAPKTQVDDTDDTASCGFTLIFWDPLGSYQNAQSRASASQSTFTTTVRRRITGKQKPTHESSQPTSIIPSGAESSSSTAFPKRGIG